MKRSPRQKFSALLATGFLILLASHAAFAATTGQLSGRVLDEEGSSLPGASVTINSSTQIGGSQLTVTDAEGRFFYPRLMPGVFSVLIILDGFATQEITEVQVRLDHMTELRVVLPSAQFGEEVTVSGQAPVVDPTQVSLGQTFTSDYLKRASVGSDNRDFWDVLSQAAGSERLGTRTDPSVMGSSPEENTFLIDGLDTTGVYTGGASAYLNFEAIDEISLQTGGFEAEYGRATGGVINLVTKSGSNDIEGVLDGRFRANSFESSGKFHDPEEQVSEYFATAAALGGPFLRDKLWYFFSGLYDSDRSTPYLSPTTKDTEFYNVLGKVTWQISPAWRLMGKYNPGEVNLSNRNASQFHRPEATSFLGLTDDIIQVETSASLTDRVLWTVQIGRNLRRDKNVPQSGDTATPGHFNLDTSVRSGNFTYYYEGEKSRSVISSDLSFFKDNVLGSHVIKAGAEYQETLHAITECGTGDPTESSCAPGSTGFEFEDILGFAGSDSPFKMWITRATGELRNEGDLISVFVQDSWRARPDLSIETGLRWDRARHSNSYGSRVASLEKLQPRIGAAWDATGSGKSLLRATWGQFMHPGTSNLPRWTSNAYSQEFWWSCSAVGAFAGFDDGDCPLVAAAWGWDWMTDPWGWDAAGWMFEPGNVFSSLPSVTADGLKPSFNEQLIVGFEREISPGTSLELSYVTKETKDGIDDTCPGNFPTPTAGGSCKYFVIANLPEIRKEYQAWMLRFESRTTEKFHVLGSYVNSESKGTAWWTSTQLEDTFDIYPFHYENRYGFLPDHRRHRLKLSGYLLLPWDLQLGFSGWWSSPRRWSLYDINVPGMAWGGLLLEPRGSRKTSDNHQLDLQLSKGFDIGSTRLEVIGSIYNLLSAEQPLWYCDVVDGCGEIATGDPTEWQIPRRWELGVRLEF